MTRIHKCILLIMALFLSYNSAYAISDKWRGELKMGVASLPLILNFNEQGDSILCTMDSPKQNAYGMPMSLDYFSEDSLAISSATLGASFLAHVSAQEINGIFQQRGYKFPLSFTPEEPLLTRRPQTPQPPFPYQEKDTTFYSSDGTLLAGTLTLPDSPNEGQNVMCVMVTGSGPQNRDEEIFDHKPFAIIADFLARNGIASFRYDDRGTAKSQDNFQSSTIDTFAEDALAALHFAKSLNPNGRTGLIGHSEGGTIAFLLAEEGVPDFIITLAGMAISGKETILDQNRHALKKLPLEAKDFDASMVLIEAYFDELIEQGASGNSEPIDLEVLSKNKNVTLPPMIMQSMKANLKNSSDYLKRFLSTDASKNLDKVDCPVLSLNGTLDTQVSAEKNLDVIRKNIKNAQTVEIPGLNHLFQHAQTGEVDEYSSIKETISPEVLDIIVNFLSQK